MVCCVVNQQKDGDAEGHTAKDSAVPVIKHHGEHMPNNGGEQGAHVHATRRHR